MKLFHLCLGINFIVVIRSTRLRCNLGRYDTKLSLEADLEGYRMFCRWLRISLYGYARR